MKIDGERGYYWIQRIITDDDGNVTAYGLWGGSKDPSGRRRNRMVYPEQIKHDAREVDAKLRPWKD